MSQGGHILALLMPPIRQAQASARRGETVWLRMSRGLQTILTHDLLGPNVPAVDTINGAKIRTYKKHSPGTVHVMFDDKVFAVIDVREKEGA